MNFDRSSHAGIGEMEMEVDQTMDSVNYMGDRERRRSHRRYSKAIRTQQEEDEERRKILLEALHGGANKKAAEKDKEKALRTAASIKTALAKAKQLAARAFKEDIIDQLSSAVDEQPLFHAGTMLDASARVYSFRVDVTHSEACDVRMKLGDPITLNRANGEKQMNKRPDEESISSESSDSEEECDDSGGGSGNLEKTTVEKEGRSKQGIKESADVEEDTDDEAASRSVQDAFDVSDLPVFLTEPDPVDDSDTEDAILSREQLIEKFKKRADNAHMSCLQRRSKVAMVVVDTSELDDREESSQFCGHLYSKATHNFDEGSTSGLLMQNAAIGKHGRRLLLHNDLRCPPDPPHEKIDADDLLPFYGLIDDIEKNEPPESATIFGEDDPSTSLLIDLTAQVDETQSFAAAHANTTFAVETTLSEQTRCALIRNLKGLLMKSLPCSPKGAFFVSRMRLQKKFGISSRKFAKILESWLKGIEPALYGCLMRSMLTRPGSHSHFIYARCAQSESWITNAVVADELELFEQCFDWVVNRMRWESMIDAGRAAMLKSLPAEDPDYNYFFARSSECPFPMEEDDDLDEDAYCWRSEVEIHGGEDKVTEADYKALAEVLAAFKVVKGASLFTRKGDALNRTLAAIPILTTAREKNRQLAPGPETTPLASVTAQRTVLDEMAAAETLPEIGLGEEFSGDLDAMDDMLADEDATLTNQSAVEGVQAPTVIAEENTSATAEPEMIAADSASPSTAVGDLHFLDENAILQTVSSLIADEAHWKKAKPKPGTGNVTQKQLENETKKKERPKAKKEQGAKQMFEWGDEDDLPLSVLRDRIAKSKRPLTLCRSEDDILTAPSTRKISMQLYMPHHFCKLSHIFVGEWGKLRINRASSAPLETPHDFRWIDSVVRDMQTNDQPTAGKSFMEFLSIFNGYFNDADERNIRAGSEPYLGGSSEDFFDDGVPQEDDDDLDNANTSANKLSNSMLHRSNRSFFSEADSDVEDAEMFGVKYSIRQRRINAPAVKRAIGTVLSNRELDADMLNAQLRLARQLKLDETIKLRDGDVSIVSESGELDLSLVDSRKNGLLDMSAEEEQLQIREENEMGDDPTCELHKSDVKVSNVTLSGRHTFSSLLVRVPDYLTGRTANDLNPINAFSVLLHMCNENNLELAQRRDSNNMVLPSAMGDFTILPSRRNKRKHE